MSKLVLVCISSYLFAYSGTYSMVPPKINCQDCNQTVTVRLGIITIGIHGISYTF